MRQILCAALVASALWLASLGRAGAPSDSRSIDTARSKITLRVFKSGFFSSFAHNHEIEAPIESGEVSESGSLSAELRIDARKLRVLDPEASVDTRAKIQQTMLGPQVLDADRFPKIHFRSTAVEPKGTDHWIVRGDLDLHGHTRPLAMDAELKDGIYRGTAILKQTNFGIKPVAIAGGTVNVKDEVRIEFQIDLVK